MKWYVLNHNFNKDEIELFNIFNSYNFNNGLEKLLKKYTTFSTFVDELNSLAMYCFWSKAEYEISCGGLFAKSADDLEKIDIYTQLKNNIEPLAIYILTEYNKKKRKKLEM